MKHGCSWTNLLSYWLSICQLWCNNKVTWSRSNALCCIHNILHTREEVVVPVFVGVPLCTVTENFSWIWWDLIQNLKKQQHIKHITLLYATVVDSVGAMQIIISLIWPLANNYYCQTWNCLQKPDIPSESLSAFLSLSRALWRSEAGIWVSPHIRVSRTASWMKAYWSCSHKEQYRYQHDILSVCVCGRGVGWEGGGRWENQMGVTISFLFMIYVLGEGWYSILNAWQWYQLNSWEWIWEWN